LRKIILKATSIKKINEYPTKAIPESTSILSEIELKKSMSIEFNAANNSFKNVTNSPPDPLQDSFPDPTDNPLSDPEIIMILNRFVFTLFLLFIIFLNLLCLYLLPFVMRNSLTIED
jgi:hypothetical protein